MSCQFFPVYHIRKISNKKFFCQTRNFFTESKPSAKSLILAYTRPIVKKINCHGSLGTKLLEDARKSLKYMDFSLPFNLTLGSIITVSNKILKNRENYK